jgi:hypothetical protein
MKTTFSKLRILAFVALLLGSGLRGDAGVTVITHGLNGNVDGWVTGMANSVPNYFRFPGTNFTCYQMFFFESGGFYYLTANRVAGSHPTTPESGEIVVKLDWRDLAAGGDSYDTYQVASAIAPALLNTNFIPELGGRALAEFPLHLIGHSRGGSLISEVSRLLGTNGVWIDHLTTLDPHPLNDPVFPWDWLLYDAVDAPANTYENVLFHDNYWQDIATFVYGKSVPGAYIRKLTNFNGGYPDGTTGPHSDVHLWYHGTVDLEIPTTDSEATISATERVNWWSAYESYGIEAGFYYSLIGGGDRTSTDQPVGPGFEMIRDGYNQWWDLGAGVANNRTALPNNNGNWPNLVKFNRTTTNQVVQGQGMPVKFYYQWAKPNVNLATITIYLDDDLNPINTNQTLLRQITVPGNGASSISFSTTNLTLFASNAAPGFHAVLAKITGGGRTRYLYAPELVEVISIHQPPTLDIVKLNAAQYRIGVNGDPGQTVVLESSTDLQAWVPLATNTLTTSRWDFTNSPPGSPETRYYRGVLP